MESWLYPMLCVPADVVPEGPEWIIEGKLDGWRAVTHVEAERVRLFGGRNGSSYSGKLPYIEESLRALLPLDTAVDGELIGGGAGQWNDVQGVMTRGAGPHAPSIHVPALTYVLFDVLRYEGEDVRSKPWHERRALLEGVYTGTPDHVRLSPYAEATQAQHEAFLALGLEGSVCKLKTSRYVAGKSRCWPKIKPQDTADAKVIGFKPGKRGGKFDGKVGAFIVEMVDSGVQTTVKCGSDARHDEATDHPERWLGVVIELAHFGIQPSGKPKSPQFFRRRDDRAGTTPAPTPRRAPQVSDSPSGRMRNYGAMKDPKLLKCVSELEAGSGEAYERALNGSGQPAEDLRVARGIANERGLLRAAA